MQPKLTDIIQWARHAGGMLREGYGKPHVINHKSQIDLVTEMDRLSDEYLLGQIRAQFPDHTIFSEESGHMQGDHQHTWIVDPLDGTSNYAHHIPYFSVAIAYMEDEQVKFGVVYDPLRDECFSAERGKGAFLNGQPIHVTSTDQLIDSLVITGFAYDKESIERNLPRFVQFMRITQGVRRMGSATLDMCSVAAGRCEGYWEQSVHSWDIAASGLIVEEAGGIVTSLEGDAVYLKPPYSVLAANPNIYPAMFEQLQKPYHF